PTLTPTPISASATPTRTPAPTATGPTATPTTTPTGGVLGGRNFGIAPGAGSATLIWDAGSAQNGYLVARYLPTFSLLPAGVLPASATSTTDSGLDPGHLYCYIEGPTVGSPQTLAGVSNFACVIANTQSAFGAPQSLTLRVTQAGTANLAWSPPPGGSED